MNLVMVLLAGETLLTLAASEGYELSPSFMIIGAMLEGAII